MLVPRRVQRQISGPLVAEELGSDELKGVLPAVTLSGNILASGGGYPTTDYHRLITRAVGALDRNTAEARRALYERARSALLAELRSREPAFLATDITKQRLALENAIREVEADAWQVRASEPEDEAVPLPLRRHTLTPEVEEEQNDRTRHQLSHRGPPSLPRPDWSRPLPQLLIVSGVMTVATLNDARVLIEQHLPAASRAKDMWRYVSDELRRAALGRDAAEFSSVMEMALSLEGLEWSLKMVHRRRGDGTIRAID